MSMVVPVAGYAATALGLPAGLPSASHRPSPFTSGVDWRLTHSPNPTGGAELQSILQVAEPDRSDLDLIGMMVRCGRNGPETLLIVLQPFPPRTKIAVKLTARGSSFDVNAGLIPTGAGLTLPIDVQSELSGAWHDAHELTIEIAGDGRKIAGVVKIDGLAPAVANLLPLCEMAQIPGPIETGH